MSERPVQVRIAPGVEGRLSCRLVTVAFGPELTWAVYYFRDRGSALAFAARRGFEVVR